MVKRKEVLDDKKEKVKKLSDPVRRVSKKLNFDEMIDVISPDGQLLVPIRHEVFFERFKENRPIICVGIIVSVYENGGVDVWDETHQEFFLFNYKKHYGKVKVKTYLLPPTEPHEEQQYQNVAVQPSSQLEEQENESVQFKLWIDDERNPPDDTWIIARSSQEAIEIVTNVGCMPHNLALDHDLGGEDTTLCFLHWLQETSQPEDPIPEYSVHSANPVGRENIISFIESWKKSIEFASIDE